MLLAAWTLFILYGTLLPFHFTLTREQAAAKWAEMWGHPLRSATVVDLTANVLLFLPWGASLAFVLGRRGFGPIATTAAGTSGGTALSVAVEALQLFERERYTSVVDVLTNGLGAALGAGAGWVACRVVAPSAMPRLRRAVARGPMAALLVGMAGAIGLAAVTPFDFRPDERSVKEAIKRARLVPFGPAIRGPAPPGDAWTWAAEGLAWSLAGGVCALALRESGRGPLRSAAGAVMMVAAIASACEMAQIFVGSRIADATSVVLAAGGGALGASCVALNRRCAPAAWAGPALVAWGAVLVLTAWTPPRFAAPSPSELSPSNLVPFLAYHHDRGLGSLADLVNEVLRAVPLGALLAALRRDGRGSARRAALVGFTAGAVLEVGQLFVVGRHAEVTDALLASAGSAIGFELWRRGRLLVERRAPQAAPHRVWAMPGPRR